jgi:hypothetical protein
MSAACAAIDARLRAERKAARVWRWQRFLSTINPVYDWGQREIFRLDRREPDFLDESEGNAWYFELQWFGVALEIKVGRTPPKISPDEVAARKRRHDAYEANRQAEQEACS